MKYEELIQYDHTNGGVLLHLAIKYRGCLMCEASESDPLPKRQTIEDDGLCTTCRGDLTNSGRRISSIFLRYSPYVCSYCGSGDKTSWEILKRLKIVK